MTANVYSLVRYMFGTALTYLTEGLIPRKTSTTARGPAALDRKKPSLPPPVGSSHRNGNSSLQVQHQQRRAGAQHVSATPTLPPRWHDTAVAFPDVPRSQIVTPVPRPPQQPPPHTGSSRGAPREYTCQWCGRTFDHKNNYRKHYMTHTGEKPFACSLCSYTAIQKKSLVQHMFTKHTPQTGLPPL